MDLICEKYRETERPDPERQEVSCRRPYEYCKFRSACIINLLGRERDRERAGAPEPEKEKESMLDFSKGERGLLPAVVQDYASGEVLMLAYINEAAWQRTLETGQAHYWSRSRAKLWLKGESSGHIQQVREIRVDCDADTVVFRVEQVGGAACHTGHRTCFYRRLAGFPGPEPYLETTETPVFDPAEVYKK